MRKLRGYIRRIPPSRGGGWGIAFVADVLDILVRKIRLHSRGVWRRYEILCVHPNKGMCGIYRSSIVWQRSGRKPE